MLKNTDGKYFSLDEYKTGVEPQQTDKDKKVVMLYATDVVKQYSYIEQAKNMGYDVLLMDCELDSHFVNLLEQKMENVRFARVDSDSVTNLIPKEEAVKPIFNPQYTFDSFVAGEPNKLARTAGIAIAKQPGYTAFNPLFIYGGSGVGKTHLANAIGNQVRALNPQARVLYVSANTFKLQYVDASMNNRTPDFLNFYQSVDVLIIDDIQYFAGLKGTQDTFFHIFNYLQQSRKQLILTSDRPPIELKDIEDRLLTRFKWGLSAEIKRPDYELRRNILLSKMRRDGISLPDEVVNFIANNVRDSVRDLEGILASLLAHSTLTDREIDLALTEQVVSHIVAIQPRKTTIGDILTTVSDFYQVPEKCIVAQNRSKEVMQARHVAAYLAKELTENSLNEIGFKLGKRTHATVLHSIDLIKTKMEFDPVLRQQISQMEAALRH